MLNRVSFRKAVLFSWMLLIAAQFLPVWYGSYTIVLVLLTTIGRAARVDWKIALNDKWLQLWGIYIGWQFLSLLWTSNFRDAGANLSTQVLLFGIPFLMVLWWPTKEEQQQLFKTQFYASLAAVIYALVYAYIRARNADEYGFSSYFMYSRLSETVMHPGYFSLQLIISFSYLVYALYKKIWRFNFLTISSGLFILAFLTMLNGRMTLFAAFTTLAVAGVIISIRQRRWLPIGAIGIVLLLMFGSFYMLPAQIQGRFLELREGLHYDMASYGLYQYNGITIRLAQWECATEVIKQHFWFGTGIGDGKDALFKVYEEKGFLHGIKEQFNSHNQFLENMLYGGIVQAVLLLLIFVLGIRHGFKNENWVFALFLFFILLCMQTETVLFWHRGVLFFAIFATLFYLSKGKYSNSTPAN